MVDSGRRGETVTRPINHILYSCDEIWFPFIIAQLLNVCVFQGVWTYCRKQSLNFPHHYTTWQQSISQSLGDKGSCIYKVSTNLVALKHLGYHHAATVLYCFICAHFIPLLKHLLDSDSIVPCHTLLTLQWQICNYFRPNLSLRYHLYVELLCMHVISAMLLSHATYVMPPLWYVIHICVMDAMLCLVIPCNSVLPPMIQWFSNVYYKVNGFRSWRPSFDVFCSVALSSIVVCNVCSTLY